MSGIQGTDPSAPVDTVALGSLLLAQFQNSTIHHSSSTNMPAIEREEEQLPAPDAGTGRVSTIEIVVPRVDNPDDYEYLPGHFAVRRILRLVSDDPKNPVYAVRLESGELEMLTYYRLMQLENASEALDQFNPDSDTSEGSLVPKEKTRIRQYLFMGDGAFSETSDVDTASTRHTRRGRRSGAPGQYSAYFQDEAERDEERHAVSDDSSSDELNAEPQSMPRLRRGVRQRTRMSSSDGYLASRRDTRASSRKRKSLRLTLAERLEDDLSEAESSASKQPKYVGAREVFHELSRDDEFRQRHFSCCSTCNYYEDDPEKGPLVFCQGCSSSYHQACLGPRSSREHLVTKVDEGNFILQCRRCLGVAHDKHDVSPHLGHCATCKEQGPMSQPLRERLTTREEQQRRIANNGSDPVTSIDMARVNNVDNVLFRCTSCHRAFHIHHLRPISGETPSEIFADYSTHWQCEDCSNATGEVDELVAWRLIGPRPRGPGIPHAEMIPEIDKEYLIKWKRKSYFRVTWMRGDWVWGISNHSMRRAFFKSPKSKKPISTTEAAVPEEFLRVDIVFDVTYLPGVRTDEDEANPEMVQEAYVKYKGLNYEDSVWESPPKPNETDRWDDFKAAFADWLHRDTIQPPNRSKLKEDLANARRLNFEHSLVLTKQPDMVTGGDLMEYQVEGVNWLYYMFLKQQNAILADDMGLGKTVQIIGLFAALIEKHHCWPFLVVAPNSTVPNWRREIKTWAPGIRVVTYFGSAFSRQMANDYEMFPEGGKDLRCHVVIASYESMVVDEAKYVLSRIPWAGLIVDEGQRLKNDKSQLYERLCRMKFDFKVLLTGTPLQNNIRELFNLIQFLDPAKNANVLEEKYGELTKVNIRSLHEMIRPFFLRRTKAEVLPFLPPMVQIIVPVSMSVLQKKLYKSILGKNPELIKAICKRQFGQLKKNERHNLNNILVQLRKCLCHPFIYNKDIEEQAQDPVLAHRHLVEASGKLKLLNLMLPKLRERGHRVLIFSQFLENLDIVEDFLEGLALPYCRLDGRLTARKKQEQIDKFNEPNSPLFAFLLSTRSGGVGINLATADTVIIMDPDFNPKQDMQALSRAHRIGQRNTVLVFHLTTRSSVEEKIMQKGKKKLALDHVLIERMEADEDEEDLESILRHGAEALFNDDESAAVHYDSESIDKLLDRSQVEKAETYAHDSPASSDQPQFNFARVWQNERGTLEEVNVSEDTAVDATVWEKILRERERDAVEEAYRKAEGLGRGKRKRGPVNYHQTVEQEPNDVDGELWPRKLRKGGDHDMDFTPEAAIGAVDAETEANDGAVRDSLDIEELSVKSKKPIFKRVEVPPLPTPMNTTDGVMEQYPHCLACQRPHPQGCCPLKQAGVEYCPLCGLAHFGKLRSCPQLHSMNHVRRMLDALKESTESPELIAAAKKYLQGVVTSTMQAQRLRAARDAARNAPQETPISTPQSMMQNVASVAPQGPPAAATQNITPSQHSNGGVVDLTSD